MTLLTRIGLQKPTEGEAALTQTFREQARGCLRVTPGQPVLGPRHLEGDQQIAKALLTRP